MAHVPKPPMVIDHVPIYGGRTPEFIVLHDTEGLGSIESYARGFRANGLGSSYMVERSGRTGEYVRNLTDRTYHVKDHNTQCIGIEQVGFYTTSKFQWVTKYRTQLWATAWLTAWLCQELGIPAVAAGQYPHRGFTHTKGITMHVMVPDNDHLDCGAGYPFTYIVNKSKYWLDRGGPTAATKAIIARSVRNA